MFVYISSSLTGLTDLERELYLPFYESLGAVCEEFGFESYIPHHYGDPVTMRGLTPNQIDEIDRKAVTMSAIVVAYVGKTSTGAGIEIEMAYHSNKPLILLYEKSTKVSRLALGAKAAVVGLPFHDFNEAYLLLRGQLHKMAVEEATKPWLPPPLRLFPINALA
jgi:nucleoside 2-deoxyribosyltransferase